MEQQCPPRHSRKLFRDFVLVNFLPKKLRKKHARRAWEQMDCEGSWVPASSSKIEVVIS